LNHLGGVAYSVYCWTHKNLEVDFVVKTAKGLWDIEVKSGNSKKPKGIPGFLSMYPVAHAMIIGSEGITLEMFFRSDPSELR